MERASQRLSEAVQGGAGAVSSAVQGGAGAVSKRLSKAGRGLSFDRGKRRSSGSKPLAAPVVAAPVASGPPAAPEPAGGGTMGMGYRRTSHQGEVLRGGVLYQAWLNKRSVGRGFGVPRRRLTNDGYASRSRFTYDLGDVYL